MDSYTTIKQRSYFEYEDRKSIFIGEAMPVSRESEAIDFIQMMCYNVIKQRKRIIFYDIEGNNGYSHGIS